MQPALDAAQPYSRDIGGWGHSSGKDRRQEFWDGGQAGGYGPFYEASGLCIFNLAQSDP